MAAGDPAKQKPKGSASIPSSRSRRPFCESHAESTTSAVPSSRPRQRSNRSASVRKPSSPGTGTRGFANASALKDALSVSSTIPCVAKWRHARVPAPVPRQQRGLPGQRRARAAAQAQADARARRLRRGVAGGVTWPGSRISSLRFPDDPRAAPRRPTDRPRRRPLAPPRSRCPRPASRSFRRSTPISTRSAASLPDKRPPRRPSGCEMQGVRPRHLHSPPLRSEADRA